MTYIHQVAITDVDLDGYVTPNRENLNEFFPDAKYEFWDLPRIKSELVADGATEILNAINNIHAYALKGEIARYYMVYKYGGWYVDLNDYFVKSTEFLDGASLVVFGEIQQTAETTWAVQNGLFYAEPGHEVFRKTLETCVENVKNKFYGINAWSTTGPNVVGAAVASQKLEPGHRQRYGKVLYHPSSEQRGFYINEIEDSIYANFKSVNEVADVEFKPFALYKPDGLEYGNSGLIGGNDYIEMWDRKAYFD